MRNFIAIAAISIAVISCKSIKNSTTTATTEESSKAQNDTIEVVKPTEEKVEINEYSKQPLYQAEYTKHFDLIHTKLRVSFDWEKRYLYGKAAIQLEPYFYPQDSLILDAKHFKINSIHKIDGNNKLKLPFEYDGKLIRIKLDKTYHKGELFTILVDYTAKPYERKAGGSDAITADRGLYFVNHDSTSNKPQQIWTQGETEASSGWFPTIDAPNQRCTQEIYITVNEKFKTLSNGDLIYSQENGDGTRTDYWKMEKPHAPYLFMMAIGDFAIVKDEWNNIPLSYYVEPEYEQYARDIFGSTPEMLTYFSELINYPYPWSKYAQVVVRDYVSGAMENTTASVFMEGLQIDKRALIDKDWDFIIAHELIHQWFGDLVTCESWANLTLNESFANYSEYLWEHHKNGDAAGQFKLHTELQNYLNEAARKKADLIRFNYDHREDMFDSHSYAKGGLILHMLRQIVGDKAFFASLHQYLEDNKYQDVEIHDLRLAFEEVTGKDMNWFFNQWYLDKGHPVIRVEDNYIDSLNTLQVNVKQIQNLEEYPLYQLPVKINYWVDGQKRTDSVILTNEYHQYEYEAEQKPELVLFDPDEYLVAQKEHKKDIDEYAFQYEFASNAVVRYNALNNLLEAPHQSLTYKVFKKALNDDFYENRLVAMQFVSNYEDSLTHLWKDQLIELAASDPKSEVRSDAMIYLAENIDSKQVDDIVKEASTDSSYIVSGSAIYILLDHPNVDKDSLINEFKDEQNVNIVLPLANFFVVNQDTTKLEWFKVNIENGGSEKLFYMLRMFGQYLMNAPDNQKIDGARSISDVAINNSKYFIRIAAYQSLELISDSPEVKKLMRKIREQESDKRVINYFN